MWLQRVIFNLQTRLIGREDEQTSPKKPARSVKPRRQTERVQLFQTRLLDMDRRLAQLR
ncbi:MAG: hypothetical protein GY854_22615 [Deltaproteobacteria bacterium]|nr:hypothetical protein [Deltaproteobacteria bacterium]